MRPSPPSFGEALRFWVKLGFISFGGPAGQIAIMHRELVEKRRWISERRFLNALNYCMLLPGPEAQQLATYLGWLLHRTAGGIAAGAFFILPSLFILIGLSWAYSAYGNLPVIAAIFWGIKPAVVAIVAHAALRIGSRTLKGWMAWSIAGAALAAIALAAPFPAILIGAALVGLLAGRIAPGRFAAGPAATAAGPTQAQAVIGDDTPPPPHAIFRWPRLLALAAVGALLWFLTMGCLYIRCGWNHAFTQMGWFFTKAALLTYGGAYGMLPYVYQGAVEHHGWLTATQMLDGLALGESTPGPLIMIVTFAGFVGGYQGAYLGPAQAFASGLAAALLVTWVTFLPSFLFILGGAPLAEAARARLRYTAPLLAVTAAVTGVIAHLALFFAYHVIWPGGFPGGPDWPAVLIACAAAGALFVFKRGILEVMAAAGVAGLLLHVPGLK